MRSGVDVAFEDSDGRAGDARLEFAFVFADFHVNVAEAAHVFTLGDVEGVTSAQFSVADEIGAEGAARGAGGGIFNLAPRKHAARGNIAGFFQSEAVRNLSGTLGRLLKEVGVALNFSQGSAIRERDH